jgi:hypothetical protein
LGSLYIIGNISVNLLEKKLYTDAGPMRS